MPSLIDSLGSELKELTHTSKIRGITSAIGAYEEQIGKYVETKKLFGNKSNVEIERDFNIKKSENEEIQSYSETIERKLYRDISNLIERKAQDFYQAVTSNQDVSSLYKEIIVEVKKMLEQGNIKAEIQEILLEMGEDPDGKYFEEMKSNLLYGILKNTIPKYLKREILKCVPKETDKDGDSLLALACKKGNLDLVKYLIRAGWGDKSTLLLEKIVETELQTEKIAEKRSALEEILRYLKTPDKIDKSKNARGVMGMVALMGASASPAKKVSILEDDEFNVENLDRYEKVDIRPVEHRDKQTGVAITPGKTEVHPVWKITINKDNESTKKEITLLLDQKKSEKKIQDFQKEKQETAPPTLPPNTKTSFISSGQIDKVRLARWEEKSKKEARYRSQTQTMGWHTAAAITKKAGFESKGWQWCHLIAFSMGGQDGIEPNGELNYDSQGPQRESNLVIGTTEANAQMLIVESLVKDLVIRKGVESLFIIVKANFSRGLDKYHIADSLEYTIQDDMINPKRQISFTFDMLDRRKTVSQEPELIEPILEELFLRKGDSIFPELTRDIRTFPSPSVFSTERFWQNAPEGVKSATTPVSSKKAPVTTPTRHKSSVNPDTAISKRLTYPSSPSPSRFTTTPVSSKEAPFTPTKHKTSTPGSPMLFSPAGRSLKSPATPVKPKSPVVTFESTNRFAPLFDSSPKSPNSKKDRKK